MVFLYLALPYLFVAALASVVAHVGTLLVRRFAVTFNLADAPNERRINTTLMPRAGGFAAALSFFLVGATVTFLAAPLGLTGGTPLPISGIAALLLASPQHLTAEQILCRLREGGMRISKATVYNTLNLFAAKGVIRQLAVDGDRAWFDSNTEPLLTTLEVAWHHGRQMGRSNA